MVYNLYIRQIDKGIMRRPVSTAIVAYYLILKSYTKYKIDRDRTIAHNTDKNREEKITRSSSRDETANVNFSTTTSYTHYKITTFTVQ